jgi:hypothetical protein
LQRVLADRLVDNVYALSVRNLAGGTYEVFARIIDDVVTTEISSDLRLRVGTNSTDHGGPEMPRPGTEALPVKKPKKPKVKSFSAIQKKTNRNLSPLPREPIQNPAKSLPQTNSAGQQPHDQQMKNPPKRWSPMKRAVAVVVAVVGLIAPKRPKGP